MSDETEKNTPPPDAESGVSEEAVNQRVSTIPKLFVFAAAL